MISYSSAAVEFCDDLCDLHSEIAEWSQATFGSDKVRGPIGPLRHLAKEAMEAADAVASGSKEKTGEEFADCLMCLMDAMRRAGFKFDEVIKQAKAKMVVNRSRQWPKPTSDEPVEHIRDTDEPATGVEITPEGDVRLWEWGANSSESSDE